MAHSERHEELVAAVALGLPLGNEQAELDRHLAEGCAVCEGLLADFRRASTAMAAGVPEVAPPPHLKDRILGALGPSRGTATATATDTDRPAVSAFPWRALAAAAALALIAVAVDDTRLRRQREELRSETASLANKLRTTE